MTLALLSLMTSFGCNGFSDDLSVSGVAAWGGQCQRLEGRIDFLDTCRGALPFQPRFSFRPSAVDEVFVKLGFAAGSGLNDVPPFELSPWGAEMSDDVRDINGTGRNYLLTAWYAHAFELAGAGDLRTTVGIIDSLDYLDENLYANDEYSQFMNEAFVNNQKAFLASYDWGAALEWDIESWAARAVVMNVHQPGPRDSYRFAGAQLGYEARTRWGKGNYRILVSGTSESFDERSGSGKERRAIAGFSFDQQVGKTVGAFLRFSWQSADAEEEYDGFYSGGINISGSAWRRPDDNIGLGIAYVSGGGENVRHSEVAEAYYRYVVNERFAVTGDVQYIEDELERGGGPEGLVFGIRTTVEF